MRNRPLPLPLRAALATVALSLLAACSSSGEDQTIQPSPTPTDVATPDTSPTPTPAETAAECSASDLAGTAVQPQGLTEAAAETWNDLRGAALACDYDALADLAGEDFSFSFGGGDDPATYWREAEEVGESVLADLVRILGLPVAEDDEGNAVWPRVHLEPEDDAAWEEVARIYDPEDVSSWREAGSYFGYRTAIAPDGTWVYLIAGD